MQHHCRDMKSSCCWCFSQVAWYQTTCLQAQQLSCQHAGGDVAFMLMGRLRSNPISPALDEIGRQTTSFDGSHSREMCGLGTIWAEALLPYLLTCKNISSSLSLAHEDRESWSISRVVGYWPQLLWVIGTITGQDKAASTLLLMAIGAYACSMSCLPIPLKSPCC